MKKTNGPRSIGPGLLQLSPVNYWYQHGHFTNEDEARGAFKLAYQQYMDGMGKSAEDWMGITTEEFDAWCRSNILPSRDKRRSKAPQ